MAEPIFDAAVVGAGPAGSTAALVLSRGGARVALVDRATFERDKACGDLVGPRALALLASLSLTPPGGRQVGEMLVVGPTGRRVLLPARAGRTYPGHALAVPRLHFDAWLREAAIAAGAEPITSRAVGASPGRVELDDGRQVRADVVVGADGAMSGIGAAFGMVDTRRTLWGFAHRGYVGQDVERPIISLWDDVPGHGFPGYGWLFPGDHGVANVGLGLGLGSDRSTASRAVAGFEAFCLHLSALGLLEGHVEGRRLGGWLKMGLVGTTAARGRVLLVGDAAGLVNPLQGEGIAPAMTSGAAAARAILAGPDSAAAVYLRFLAEVAGPYGAFATPIHALAIGGSARRVSRLGRTLTLPGVGAAIASTWAVTWNDLVDGAPPSPTTAAARFVRGAGRVLTARTAVRRGLADDLAGR